MRWRRRRALGVATVAAAALALGACGGDSHENDPRPAVPEEIAVKIGEERVIVSPRVFGAGLANFTIANFSGAPAAIEIDGPVALASGEIPPGGNARLKTEMASGEYVALAIGSTALPAEFDVGPDNPTAENELLLP